MALRIASRLFLVLYAVIIAVPLLLVVATSLKDSKQFYARPLGLPSPPSFSNYVSLFKDQPMLTYFGNSVLVAAATVALGLLLAGMVAYGVFRVSNKIGAALFGLYAAGLMVPSQVNMIPIYSFVRQLGLTNNRAGLVLVSVSLLLPISVFMLTGFMRTLSRELFEAAGIDGAGEWTLFVRIALPLSAPYLAATAAFLFVIVWNDLLFPLLLMSERSKLTLPLAMLQFQGEFATDYPRLLTGVVVVSLPMVVLFVFLQKYFVTGMTAGSLKG
jgi:raffinose/stachyose/melibiose transport system permease protein